MVTRTLYFLKDSVTGKYYMGKGLYLESFEFAMIHTTFEQASHTAREIARIYERDLGWNNDVPLESIQNCLKQAKLRQSLDNFGIQIIKTEI